jgi:hypothetical protein
MDPEEADGGSVGSGRLLLRVAPIVTGVAGSMRILRV